ncbi:divalent-cation tolerance protein CutA [Halobacteria archaeon AArc-m2/3/4]|uniref:Divalent-cation tolerance protein CutA n=1 Tax=Natronoglomus mannanivorans TaxID=2979990 RepID=A0AAP2Z0C1_9EURY|nr:divalent-cation tolerance protein CutA [Halobacteria archaeon AArc-xg1-1]MCU4971254.1 divalent-cation tolerance protein CutA [Halobacteria archaeon AArc-m2/3/4]
MPTVYITAPPDAAADLVERLLEERLVACVNQFPCQSTYRWDGAIHHDDEVILLAKTTDDAYDDLVACVREHHPYDVPCIERFDETDVLEAFASWREDAVE